MPSVDSCSSTVVKDYGKGASKGLWKGCFKNTWRVPGSPPLTLEHAIMKRNKT